ncbi:MAG: toxin-antitoxin system HicB family antitoxin [Anaerolineaceae bacterium]|nr:toxin-antitoxin system HicB family antitoxin [Anaerolineaceae bacterium]
MSAFSVRLPEYYRQRIRELAKQDGVSINQFIALAVGEKISALDTAQYLAERGKKGDRQKFLKALDNVPNVPPTIEEDRID